MKDVLVLLNLFYTSTEEITINTTEEEFNAIVLDCEKSMKFNKKKQRLKKMNVWKKKQKKKNLQKEERAKAEQERKIAEAKAQKEREEAAEKEEKNKKLQE